MGIFFEHWHESCALSVMQSVSSECSIGLMPLYESGLFDMSFSIHHYSHYVTWAIDMSQLSEPFTLYGDGNAFFKSCFCLSLLLKHWLPV